MTHPLMRLLLDNLHLKMKRKTDAVGEILRDRHGPEGVLVSRLEPKIRLLMINRDKGGQVVVKFRMKFAQVIDNRYFRTLVRRDYDLETLTTSVQDRLRHRK